MSRTHMMNYVFFPFMNYDSKITSGTVSSNDWFLSGRFITGTPLQGHHCATKTPPVLQLPQRPHAFPGTTKMTSKNWCSKRKVDGLLYVMMYYDYKSSLSSLLLLLWLLLAIIATYCYYISVTYCYFIAVNYCNINHYHSYLNLNY